MKQDFASFLDIYLAVPLDEVDVRLVELLRGEPPKARSLTYVASSR